MSRKITAKDSGYFANVITSGHTSLTHGRCVGVDVDFGRQLDGQVFENKELRLAFADGIIPTPVVNVAYDLVTDQPARLTTSEPGTTGGQL